MILVGIFIALSIILMAVYIVLNNEHAGGVGERLRYTKTLTAYLNKKYYELSNAIDTEILKLLEVRRSPSKEERKSGNMLFKMAIAMVILLAFTGTSSATLLAVMGAGLVGLCMPYATARANQKEFEEELDKEVAEMFEVFNFYLSSGRTLEESLALTSENSGARIAPHMKKLVNNLMLQSKEEAIDRLAYELYFNQNILIFCSALKQAIKGYADTLTSFVSMQSKLYVQLKNEQIERIIMQMPTKFSMVSALLIIAIISFLVVPVFTNVFSGMNIFLTM